MSQNKAIPFLQLQKAHARAGKNRAKVSRARDGNHGPCQRTLGTRHCSVPQQMDLPDVVELFNEHDIDVKLIDELRESNELDLVTELLKETRALFTERRKWLSEFHTKYHDALVSQPYVMGNSVMQGMKPVIPTTLQLLTFRLQITRITISYS